MTPADRIAQLEAELAEARTARDLNRQEFEDAHAACLRTQAEAGAMRQALMHAMRIGYASDLLNEALKDAAGRALLERHAAELRQAQKEIDKQRRIRESVERQLNATRQESRRNADEFAEQGCRMHDLQAALERAVAALREASEINSKAFNFEGGDGTSGGCSWDPRGPFQEKIDTIIANEKPHDAALLGRAVAVLAHAVAHAPCSCGPGGDHDDACPHFGADAILADATATQAADAWRAQQEERASLLDWCKAWLIRARLAIYREGWEEGMSATEATDALTSVLFNLGCDDGSERPHDVAETKRLLSLPVTYTPPTTKDVER